MLFYPRRTGLGPSVFFPTEKQSMRKQTVKNSSSPTRAMVRTLLLILGILSIQPPRLVGEQTLPRASATPDKGSSERLDQAREIHQPSFRFGMYSYNLLPPEQAFREWANAGIRFVWINQAGMARAYGDRSQVKNINLLAKNYGIELMVQLFYQPEWGMDESKMKRAITDYVRWVNALPDSDAIVAWGYGDEIENPPHIDAFPGQNEKEKRAASSKAYTRFAQLLKEMDPKRRTIIDHSDPPWISSGEEETWCSTPFAARACQRNILKRQAEARKLGHDNMILVAQVASVMPTWEDMTYSGYPQGMTGAEFLSQHSAAQIIREYMLAAYENKTAGIIFYCYDGEDQHSSSPHIFKDTLGRDILGRWPAFVEASREIQKRMGRPLCQLIWYAPGHIKRAYCYDPKTQQASLHVVVTPGARPIEKVALEYSSDAGYHWQTLGQAVEGKGKPFHYRLDVDVNKLASGKQGLFRARAFDGEQWSAWSISSFFRVGSNEE